MTTTKGNPDEQDAPFKDDHYGERLASENEENSVLATQDICNESGAILVKKGTSIDQSVAERILKHKLFAPLENQIKLDKELNNATNFQHAQKFFEKYPDLRVVNESSRYKSVWYRLLKEYSLPSVLWQKLTVLHHQMPKEYEKGIFCAWLSVLIGCEMHLPDEQIESLFQAGYAHDLGMLHIDPQILNKRGNLSAAEWRAIQSHVLTGKMMIENIPGHNPATALAIMEHHERCDGTGYPAKKSARGLQLPSLIVGIADSLQAIRVNQFERIGRNLFDALPYLHMNSQTFSYPVYQAVDKLLSQSGLKPSLAMSHETEQALVEETISRGGTLQGLVHNLEVLQNTLSDSVQKKHGEDLYHSLVHVRTMIDSSGLLEEDLIVWLKSVRDQSAGSFRKELVEIDLMLNELRWQLKNLFYAFNQFYEDECLRGMDECCSLKKTIESLLDNLS